MSNWLDLYRSNKNVTWIKCQTSDDKWHYFHDHKEWLEIKKAGVGVKTIQLQFRSHIIDVPIEDCEGVYLVKSVLGLSGVVTKYCLTVGLVKGEFVRKTQYSLPELLVENNDIDHISKCFPEAIIYEEKKKDGEKQISP